MSLYNLLMLIGGLAFFLFGMTVMSNYLEKMAGGRLEGVLRKLTSNPFKSLALGAIITIVIQSSSALTVMLVGLVNSGIMEFSQTIIVIMGSNIGTTLTSWILSLNSISSSNIFISMLKPENFSPVVALIGVFMVMGSKVQKRRDVGTILCGFAVLMYGMTMMSNSVAPIADVPAFQHILVAFDNPFMGVLIGTIFTGVIQSSAASIGVLQALSQTGQISFGMAIPIVMGANIGTCVTAIISGIGVSKKAKRVPVLHVLLNVFGTIVWLTLYLICRYIAGMPVFSEAINSFQIAIFHTIFNIGTVAILLPFSKKLANLIDRILPAGDDSQETEKKKVLLDERILRSPGLAVSQCREKTVEMASLARESFTDCLTFFESGYNDELGDKIEKQEQELDYLQDQLDTFLIKLSGIDLTEEDADLVSEMLHSITDFERIGDHAINITNSAKKMRDRGLKFSKKARSEMAVLASSLREILDLTCQSFHDNDEKKAGEVEPLEEVIDDLITEIKNRHIDRLATGECQPELGITLTDWLTNCERVSDHCSNVAVCIIQTKNSSFETHGYLTAVKQGHEPEFVSEFDAWQEKYQLPENTSRKKKNKGKADKDVKATKDDKNIRTGKTQKSDKNYKSEKTDKSEKVEKSDKSDKREKKDKRD